MIDEDAITAAVRMLPAPTYRMPKDPPDGQGTGAELCREAIEWEAKRVGLTTSIIAHAWRVGLSVDQAIELVRQKYGD